MEGQDFQVKANQSVGHLILEEWVSSLILGVVTVNSKWCDFDIQFFMKTTSQVPRTRMMDDQTWISLYTAWTIFDCCLGLVGGFIGSQATLIRK